MTALKVLSLLKKHREGLPFEKILAELDVKRRDRAKLLANIRALEPEGHVRFLRGRFLLAERTGLVRGRFVTDRPGFGFVAPSGGGRDIFIPARHSQGTLPGDEVAVVVNERGKFGKAEGKVERILKKGRTVLLGVYRERGGAPFLQPFDSPSQDDVPLNSRGKLRPGPGMLVEADRATLTITRVFGMPEEPGVDAEVVIGRYGLRPHFPEEVLREAGGIPEAVPAESQRRTLIIDQIPSRSVFFLTISPQVQSAPRPGFPFHDRNPGQPSRILPLVSVEALSSEQTPHPRPTA